MARNKKAGDRQARPATDSENPRPGLRPLPVHVVAIMSAYARNPTDFPYLAQDMIAMIAGIKAYQEHPFQRPASPVRELWRQGEARLLFHKSKKRQKTGAVFLVPSMINRAAILDLLPDRSFLRWLAAQGRDVYMIDWGNPVNDPDLKSLGDVIGKRLVPALAKAAALHGGRLDAIGYCMGGTLLAGAAMLAPEYLRRTVYLASPWDFHGGDRILTSHIQMGTPSALQSIAEKGSLSADWIQSVFAVVSADRTVKKFADFGTMDQASAEAQLFIAVEDWLNDGIDFPGGVAQDCIVGWYNENRPARGQWKIGRRIVNPAKIKIPSLVVASANDRLVPQDAALALAKLLPDCEILQPATGHIGMMSGKRAQSAVWEPLRDWLDKT